MNADAAARIDAICDSFEQRWRSGAEPDPVSLLANVAEELRVPLAQQLMLIDTEYRRSRHGKSPSVDEYAVRLGINAEFLWAVADTFTKAAVEDTATFVGQTPDDADSASEWNIPVSPGFKSEQPNLSIRGYRILSELGRGGMGVVYKARQLRPGRMVAIKTLHSPQLADPELILRFQAEAEAAGRLDHRGIVPVYEVGDDNGIHFFSMGFVEGIDLEKKAREHVLSCREAALICKDIAEALEYAHQNGVVHRDIKPQNILMDKDGKPRITDFGLAKLANRDTELTASGQIMGTAAYMPPEQATGKTSEAGPTADVYALGATLYRCITGRPPFQAASAIEILRQVVEDEPISPRRLNKEIDSDIETLCLKCLEKDPSQRFLSAGELANELTRYLSDEPILSRPISKLMRVLRWCRRRPAVAASVGLATTLTLAIIAGIPYVLWQQLQLSRSQQHLLLADIQIKEQTEAKLHANEVAATQSYFATVRKVSEQRTKPTPGWTWTSLDELEEAARSVAVGKDPVELRSLITEVLLTPDLKEVFRLRDIRESGSIEISRDGRWLAIGDRFGVPTSDVNIYEVKEASQPDGTNQITLERGPSRTCRVFTGQDKVLNSLKRFGLGSELAEREGIRAISFDHDASHIIVGTRNGKIIKWQIENNSSREIFTRELGSRQLDRVEISRDGRRIYCQWVSKENRDFFSELDGQTGATINELQDRSRDFDLLNDGRPVLSNLNRIPGLLRLSALDFSDQTSVSTLVERLDLFSSPEKSLLITHPWESPSAILIDPLTGLTGISLEADQRKISKLFSAADTGVIVGSVLPEFVRIWDGLSGRMILDVPFAGNEIPLVAVDTNSNRLFAAAQDYCVVADLRAPQRLPTQTNELAPNASIGSELYNVVPLAAGKSPISVYAPGQAPVQAFDVNSDGRYLATLEQFAADAGARTRVRKLDSTTGEQVGCWICAALGDPPADIPVTGADISFLGTGEQIGIVADLPGNVVVLSDSGFQVPSGVGLDASHAAASTAEENIATWTLPKGLDDRDSLVAVAIYFPRALYQENEHLEFELSTNAGSFKVTANDLIVESKGWYLFHLKQLSPSELKEPCTLNVVINAGSLKFSAARSRSTKNSENLIVGDIFVFPRNGSARESLSIGPLVGRADGGLACVVESWLYQWNKDLGVHDAKPWTDLLNSQLDILAVASGNSKTLLGTKSGVVGQIDTAGAFRLLKEGMAGSTLTQDGITAAAIDHEGHFAAAGNFGGQLRFFDLAQPKNAPVHITDAHNRTISALAIAQDGQLLASASETGSLKLWKPHPDHLELLFALANDTSPIVDLRFSPNGEYLYLLRSGERGVRRMDMQSLRNVFEGLKLNW